MEHMAKDNTLCKHPNHDIRRAANWIQRTAAQDVASQLVKARVWRRKYLSLLGHVQKLAIKNIELAARIAELECARASQHKQ